MITLDKTLTAFAFIFISSALWPILPNFTLIIVSFVTACICIYFNVSAWTCGALLGFFWASLTGYWYTTWQLDKSWLNQHLLVEGTVESIHSFDYEGKAGNVRFNFTLHRAGRSALKHSPVVRLNWYRASHLPKQGQYYRFLVKLKAPSSLANPNTFHYQTWLASKNILATGYILESESNALLKDTKSMRQRNIDTLSDLSLKHTAWLQGLSFGYRGGFSPDDWLILQTSGTAHLFAISGLHVGIVFAYAFFVGTKMSSLIIIASGDTQTQARKIGSVFAGVVCVFYAYLAGYEIPVTRAIIAMLLCLYLTLSDSYWRLTSILVYIVSIFIIIFPYAILSVSFWFSFIAVISIWVFVWRFSDQKDRDDNDRSSVRNRYLLRIKHLFKNVFLLQLWLCIITIPLTHYIFGQLPLFSFLTNLLLVPWVSIVLVPLCLLASLAMFVGLPDSIYLALYKMADGAMDLTLIVMQRTSLLTNNMDIPDIRLDAVSMALLLLMALMILLPFWPMKKFIVAMALAVIVGRVVSSPLSYPQLTVFDVGQGSAALFTFVDEFNKPHVWLFDTGASFPSGFSMAGSVILPNLEAQGISSIDKLFLSHLDNDHAGGLNVLKEQIRIVETLSPSNKCDVAPSSWYTNTGKSVSIDVIWPITRQSGEENNHSCVIKLSVDQNSILFAGDIEQEAEQAILGTVSDKSRLQVDILIAPHHGSRTSSTEPFVHAISPSFTVFSAGTQNRWGFPHDEVVQRYEKLGSEIFITGQEGAIEFTFKTKELVVKAYRRDKYVRWYFKAAN